MSIIDLPYSGVPYVVKSYRAEPILRRLLDIALSFLTPVLHEGDHPVSKYVVYGNKLHGPTLSAAYS
ncbi:hypothetical protein N7481_004496 [Penicillium waksmanii]|uniref:uncharacterized protein n=1 Tax=Penicillium waksmanii TaxID=69791 RepID=UPI0025478FC4|nr:uncharacterized protein N7481_004496 [Penicillium waksmanii]KAJ5989286.1 hypothetical protein N7481_004496 [Penicillium waksmanii]